MSDKPRSYIFKPHQLLEGAGGTFQNPILGEIEAGQTYEIPAGDEWRFINHPDWQPAK